jgi:hypothetical protein
MDDYHLKNLLKKYFNLSQLISKREPFGMWKQKRSVNGKKITPFSLQKLKTWHKPGQNLRQTKRIHAFNSINPLLCCLSAVGPPGHDSAPP